MTSWEEELGEFLRVEQELDIPITRLRRLYEESHVVQLDDGTWGRLQNAESTGMERGQHVAAFAYAEGAGRDLARVMSAVVNGGVLPVPVVLIRECGTPYLVAGNTRLMACRVEGRTPAVLLLDARPRPSSFRRGRP